MAPCPAFPSTAFGMPISPVKWAALNREGTSALRTYTGRLVTCLALATGMLGGTAGAGLIRNPGQNSPNRLLFTGYLGG